MKKIFLAVAIIGVSFTTQAQKLKNKQNKNISNQSNQTTSSNASEADEQVRKNRIALEQSKMLHPMHHMMREWAGPWREEIKIFNGNDDKPTVTSAMRDGRTFGEERFLTINTMGNIGSNPFQGQTIIGYNTTLDKFQKVYFDNLSNSILVLEGTLDPKSNEITYIGSTLDPATKAPVKIRQVQKFISHDKQILEVYMQTKDGSESKAMEITSIR